MEFELYRADMNTGREASSRVVTLRYDVPEVYEFRKVVLDQMPRLTYARVIDSARNKIEFWPDQNGLVLRHKQVIDALIVIERIVGAQQIGRDDQ